MSATLLHAAPLNPSRTALASPGARWTGRVLTGLAVLFLVFDTTIKLVAAPEAVAGTTQLGWQAHHLPILGLIEVVCLVLYLLPRTAVLGAVLWTGYLGGALATHLRLDNPLFTHVLFPIYVATLLWGGLVLRDARLRALLRPAR
ncbi:MAG TPA: DoxX family protein [Rhodothermales bacterium]|nr:DoxX family protein [Rhodothermales bacterium]